MEDALAGLFPEFDPAERAIVYIHTTLGKVRNVEIAFAVDEAAG